MAGDDLITATAVLRTLTGNTGDEDTILFDTLYSFLHLFIVQNPERMTCELIEFRYGDHLYTVFLSRVFLISEKAFVAVQNNLGSAAFLIFHCRAPPL